jgi:hypothetical protein
VAAIHKAALLEGFETGWREKNNLTDAELDLFWDQLNKKTMVNVENWKQHYVAWAFVWVTLSRPGSLTVGSKLARLWQPGSIALQQRLYAGEISPSSASN